MNVLKSKKANNQNIELNEDFILNGDILNKDELKQIKGGTADGDDDDGYTLIDPV